MPERTFDGWSDERRVELETAVESLPILTPQRAGSFFSRVADITKQGSTGSTLQVNTKHTARGYTGPFSLIDFLLNDRDKKRTFAITTADDENSIGYGIHMMEFSNTSTFNSGRALHCVARVGETEFQTCIVDHTEYYRLDTILAVKIFASEKHVKTLSLGKRSRGLFGWLRR